MNESINEIDQKNRIEELEMQNRLLNEHIRDLLDSDENKDEL